MAVEITIVGLGQIGASIGLALEERKSLLHRVGHDKNPGTAKDAQKKGAVDDVQYNLPASVRKANIVLLCLPVSEIRPTLEIIAKDLQDGTVVMDTAPVKEPVVQWMQELLPEGCHYVGLTPAINPKYLFTSELGNDTIQKDLFKNSVITLSILPDTTEETLKLASDLIRLLGATPLFGDIIETDGLMSSTHLIPQLMAVALLNATVDRPGWHDARKLASGPFARLTSTVSKPDGFEALSEATLLNQKNVTRNLDDLIRALSDLRQDVDRGNRESLATRIEQAIAGRERWLKERFSADWSETTKPDFSEFPSIWERMFGIARKRK